MTPEQMRIAIAEKCGWEKGKMEIRAFANAGKAYCVGWRKSNWPPGIFERPSSRIPPDYPNDLNAMHEAEKTIPDELFERYYNILLDVSMLTAKHQRHWLDDVGWICTIDATALQRAEAFIKTVCPEKWITP